MSKLGIGTTTITDIFDGNPAFNYATIRLFQKSTDGVNPPVTTDIDSIQFTYTFSTGVLAGDTGDWSTIRPSVDAGEYLWEIDYAAISSESTDTFTGSDFAGPGVIASNIEGIGITGSANQAEYQYDSDGNLIANQYRQLSGVTNSEIFFTVNNFPAGGTPKWQFLVDGDIQTTNPTGATVAFYWPIPTTHPGVDAISVTGIVRDNSTSGSFLASTTVVVKLTKALPAPEPGADAPIVALSSNTLAVPYNVNGAIKSATTITLTAVGTNLPSGSSAYYKFYKDASSTVLGDGSATYTYSAPSAYTSMPDTITVVMHENNTNGAALSTDSVTIIGVKDPEPGTAGNNAISIVTSNPTQSVSSDKNLSLISSVPNSSTTINVYEGGIGALVYNSNSSENINDLANGEWSINKSSIVDTNIEVNSTISIIGNTTASVGDASNFAAGESDASIIFPIYGKASDGTQFSGLSAKQTFSRSIAGQDSTVPGLKTAAGYLYLTVPSGNTVQIPQKNTGDFVYIFSTGAITATGTASLDGDSTAATNNWTQDLPNEISKDNDYYSLKYSVVESGASSDSGSVVFAGTTPTGFWNFNGVVTVGDLSATGGDVTTITGDLITTGAIKGQGTNNPSSVAAPTGSVSGTYLDLTNGEFVVGSADNYLLFDSNGLKIRGELTADDILAGGTITGANFVTSDPNSDRVVSIDSSDGSITVTDDSAAQPVNIFQLSASSSAPVLILNPKPTTSAETLNVNSSPVGAITALGIDYENSNISVISSSCIPDIDNDTFNKGNIALEGIFGVLSGTYSYDGYAIKGLVTNAPNAWAGYFSGGLGLYTDKLSIAGESVSVSVQADYTSTVPKRDSGGRLYSKSSTLTDDLFIGKTAANLSTNGIQLFSTAASNSGITTSTDDTSDPCIYFVRKPASSATTGTFTTFQWANSDGSSRTTKGSISYDGSVVAYNTTSDYRLKENIQELSSSWDTIRNLNPVEYNMLDNPARRLEGFIAHELAEVTPNNVMGEKDAVDSENNPIYQQVNLQGLIPVLTAALKECITRIENLEAEIESLKLP